MTNSLDQPLKTKKKKGVAKPISLNRLKIKSLNSAVAVAAVALVCLASSGIATAGEVSQDRAVGTHVIGYPTTGDTQFATCSHISGLRSCRGACISRRDKDMPDGKPTQYSFVFFSTKYADSDFFPGTSERHKEQVALGLAKFSDIIQMLNPRRGLRRA